MEFSSFIKVYLKLRFCFVVFFLLADRTSNFTSLVVGGTDCILSSLGKRFRV